MTDPDQSPAPNSPVQRRAAVRLLEMAGAELGVRVETFCGDWIVRLVHADGRTRLVWGYHFDLNPSAGALVAKDKAATYAVLRAAGVAAVEHRLFLRADLTEYVGANGSWRAMLETFEQFGGEAVIKPVDGSGGAGVTRVRSARELEQTAGALWLRHHAICLSPFVAIRREVRHVLLDGEAAIVYEKQIDALVGDGRSTLGELIVANVRRDDPMRWTRHLGSAAKLYGALSWDHVPAAGARLAMGWKHNLRGATATAVERPDRAMQDLAKRAAAALGLRLCAVDVVETDGAAEAMVLEVNAGLMVERYVEQAAGGWERAVTLCREVLRRMFEEREG